MIPLTKDDELRLLDDADLAQVRLICHAIVASRGLPWREAQARIDQIHKIPPARRMRLSIAARRLLVRPSRGLPARVARARVLGHPALSADARAARLAVVSKQLGVSIDQLERALWSDLAQERTVELPDGRGASPEQLVDPRKLAALANRGVLEAALRKSHAVSLRLWGRTSDLSAVIIGRGLQAKALDDGDATRFEIRGPLSVLQKTTIYGRSLALALVPVLVERDRFTLEIRLDQYGERVIVVEPPILL